VRDARIVGGNRGFKHGASRRSATSFLFVIFFLSRLSFEKLPGAVSARQFIVRGRSGDIFVRLRPFAQEAQQLRVDFLRMRPGDAVRPAFHDY